MFLKLLFLEGQDRYKKLFKDNPPKKIYVFTKRIVCAKNGDFETYNCSAVCYARFIWEKGYKGKPIVDWVNE